MKRAIIGFLVAIVCAFVAGFGWGGGFGRGAGPCRVNVALDRACTLAAGNARVSSLWIAPSEHTHRETGLLLLSRDASWAPVCARDSAAGARLQAEIDDDIAKADAPNAVVLARRLVVLLER